VGKSGRCFQVGKDELKQKCGIGNWPSQHDANIRSHAGIQALCRRTAHLLFFPGVGSTDHTGMNSKHFTAGQSVRRMSGSREAAARRLVRQGANQRTSAAQHVSPSEALWPKEFCEQAESGQISGPVLGIEARGADLLQNFAGMIKAEGKRRAGDWVRLRDATGASGRPR